MSLQVWLPLNGDLHNQGLMPITFSTTTVNWNAAGKIGQAFSTLNSNVIGTCPNLNGVTTFSLTFWCFPKTNSSITTNWCNIIALGSKSADNSTSAEFRFESSYGNTYILSHHNNSGDPIGGGTASLVSERDKWYHVAVVVNNESHTIRYYVNGVQLTTSGFLKTHNGGHLDGTIKLANENVDPDCLLNDVRIYDHALSAKEIEEIAKGLVLHYKLDDIYSESTTNLITTIDGLSNTCYNGAINKYNYGTNTDMYKTTGIFQGKFCTKVYMGTAGNNAYPYVYFDPFNAKGTEIQTLSFDYYPTIQNTLIPYSYNGSYNFSYTSNGISGSATNVSQIIIPVNIGQWNHITITAQKYDTTNTSRGVGYVRIGSAAHTSTTTDYWLFANVQVEAKDHATGYTGVGGNRVATTIYDSSGYSNNGTIIGSLEVSTPSPRYSCATKFDGNTSCIKIPYNEINPDRIFTVNLWFHKDALGSKNYETLFGGPSGFEMDTRAGASTTLSLYMASVRGGNTFSPFNLNEWYMVTMVRNGTNEMYYINGELKKTIEAKSMPSGQYRIGAWASDTGQNYYGDISDFRIYATALTETQIKELYNTSMSIDNMGNIHARELVEV